MNKPDDLEAVRTLVDTLKAFDQKEQERIIRWAQEKLGISAPPTPHSSPSAGSRPPAQGTGGVSPTAAPATGSVDLRTFTTEKAPGSDNQFAAVVAYYYQFEAPEDQRKDTISSADLLAACRQAGRRRLGDPGKTLRNAHDVGLLDKGSERGTYKINAVGENLVAMTLPGGEDATRIVKQKRKVTRKKAAKKNTKKTAKKSKAR